MRQKTILICILLLSVLFLTGCETVYTVRNANQNKIIPLFKDYVGMHGYTLKYQNDDTGTYNVDMGQVYIPGTSSTTMTTTTYINPGTDNKGKDKKQRTPTTAYEETSWKTVDNPARYEEAYGAVTIKQSGPDVVITINTNDAGGASLNDINDYIKSYGYTVN
ncbi:hypothetical protein ACFLZ2_04560 [Candidatus Margulisiibacteriota bacterium]